MIRAADNPVGRLLVVTDIDRLGPIVKAGFAPHPITGVHSYLAGIAEIPRTPTRAVLVGHDPLCRRPEQAVAAIKAVAGDVPVVFCCEPAYEGLGRRLLRHGADDYVIFPPEVRDLERTLRIPARQTQRRWIAAPVVPPMPSAEELARLADLLPRLGEVGPEVLDDMAALVACALDAEHVIMTLDGMTGRAGETRDADPPIALAENVRRGDQSVGQIRVGPCRRGAFSHEDSAKLRQYAALFARMAEVGAGTRNLQTLAYTDDLTGLPNRRRLMQFLDEKLAVARESRTTVTALVFDIDDFKRYNDTYGHDAGDEILREIGKLFVQCCRETDLVSRLGGDEFVVVFWDAEAPRTLGSHHPSEVLNVVQRFCEALKRHAFTRLGPEATGSLTISGGLAQFPWQARTGPELIEVADNALLQAKAAGKDRFWLVGSGEVGRSGS